ncbi:DUF4361 domain-containing protein [uncultured Bacteroides sp.]|uniref:BT_3044 domain-containing protein n=1 Tax=uncultured Bacteroides sp. TaxID=162156 RepID=UPI0025D759EC|nr:DUF4361 domain-containing protein [uncultured Bacteroides sp.]
MRKIAFLSLGLLAFSLVGCDNKIPMEENLYPESVYLVGAKDRIIDKNLNIGYAEDTVYASVAISGSLLTKTDVTVKVREYPSGIEDYNAKERVADDILYRTLADDIYSIPQEEVVVKAGEVFGTYPIYINPSTLHIDSLYMLAFKLEETSHFELAKEDTVLLVRLNLMNDYSGLYYMDGTIALKDAPNDAIVYKSPRTLQAVVDGNTVRMYHQKNEWTKGSPDYRPDYCFNITVNSDNSLKLTSWDKFELIDGGGQYYPDMEVYDLWYTFRDKEDGLLKETKGFVYKERKNDDEVRKINDWMEEHRK